MSATATAWAMLAHLMRPASHRQPTRVGVLNTGELVLVDGTGAAQVISQATTALIREQLIHTDMAASELVLFPDEGTAVQVGGSGPARAAP